MRIYDLLKEKREEILPICAKHGARNVHVFGSVARREAGEASHERLPQQPQNSHLKSIPGLW